MDVFVTFEATSCPSERCGFTFALPGPFIRELRETHAKGMLFCPRCRQGIYWPRESTEERLKRELARERECCVTQKQEIRALRNAVSEPPALSERQEAEAQWLAENVREIGWTRAEAIIREYGTVEAFARAKPDEASELVSRWMGHSSIRPVLMSRILMHTNQYIHTRNGAPKQLATVAGPSNE